MKKIVLFFVILLFVSVLIWWKFIFVKEENGGKSTATISTKSRVGTSFEKSVTELIGAYYDVAESYVNWDTAMINQKAAILNRLVTSLKDSLQELDSTQILGLKNFKNQITAEVEGLILEETLYEKRIAFNLLSNQIFDFLKSIQYASSQVYFQECPMALNNYTESAFWLSADESFESRRNPYLGLSDPKYGKGMLHCGQTKDSVWKR